MPYRNLGINQQVYLRLKQALGLQLRRQIFIAICDDATLRDRLAAQLHAELAYPACLPKPVRFPSPRSWVISGGAVAAEAPLDREPPYLVSLYLNLAAPQLGGQIEQWFAQHPVQDTGELVIPSFQILGIERLTRQTAAIQHQFLTSLQALERHLPQIEFSLLLWVTRPWSRTIQQSAPEFWRWHTGLFEFEGDPTPLSAHPSPLVPASGTIPPEIGSAPLIIPAAETVSALEATPAIEPVTLIQADTPPGSVSPQTDLWDRLTQDLARLDAVYASSLEADLLDTLADQELEVIEPIPEAETAAGDRVAPGEVIPPVSEAEVTEVDSVPLAAEELPLEATQLSVALSPDSGGHLAQVTQPSVALTPITEVLPSLLSRTPDSLELADLILATASQQEQAPIEVLQLLQHIEQLQLRQAPATTLAAAYHQLGNLYRDRIEQGDTSRQTLIIAIQCYEQVLLRLEATSSLWPDVLNDLGNLYWMLSRNPDKPEQALVYLEQGIRAYHVALERTNAQTRPHTYAMIQNNLGSAYSDRARYQEPADNLQAAISAYQQSLAYRSAESDPLRYAATQNNLGTAHWNLAQYRQAPLNLRLAITAYQEALQQYDPEREPLAYAMIQNNLGTAYWNLAQYEQEAINPEAEAGGAFPEDLLLLAIGAYRIALLYRTLEAAPAAHAATQNNLGTAYWHLANQASTHYDDRLEYLYQAIAAYKATLGAAQYLKAAGTQYAPALTFDLFATHNNLGLAHYQLVIDRHSHLEEAQQIHHLESALYYHLQALQGWQQQPDYYQNALGFVIQTVRAFHELLGLKGQNLALGKVPPNLLPEIMRRLSA